MVSSLSPRYSASPDALATRVGDEIVLVDLKTDRIYSLNRTAARIWELVCADCDRAEVERRLLEEFDVAPAQLAEAIDELVAEMTEGGLLLRTTP
jgi:hypothetical protein